jgi:hypothetical protein
MADQNMDTFQDRLVRIDRIRENGGAFEAVGTLGRSHYDSNRRRRHHGLWLRPLALILAGFLVFKGGLLAQLGEDVYARRVAELAQGSVIERAGAVVMRADAATMWMSEKIRTAVY